MSHTSIILISLVTGRLPDTLTNMVDRTSRPAANQIEKLGFVKFKPVKLTVTTASKKKSL